MKYTYNIPETSLALIQDHTVFKDCLYRDYRETKEYKKAKLMYDIIVQKFHIKICEYLDNEFGSNTVDNERKILIEMLRNKNDTNY
jgi:hypothetical protein